MESSASSGTLIGAVRACLLEVAAVLERAGAVEELRRREGRHLGREAREALAELAALTLKLHQALDQLAQSAAADDVAALVERELARFEQRTGSRGSEPS